MRLLRLLPGDFEDTIKCELVETFLCEVKDGGFPYEALSYCWGGETKPHWIEVGGRDFNITTNLYDALHSLRRRDADRYLWVDAICINQAHLLEKSHQVKQMPLVYKQAEMVIIWLGRGTQEIKQLIETMKKVHSRAIQIGQEWNKARIPAHWSLAWAEAQRGLGPGTSTHTQWCRSMKELLANPWFGRVWVLQEAACAMNAIVRCGRNGVSTRTFALTPLELGIKPDRIPKPFSISCRDFNGSRGGKADETSERCSSSFTRPLLRIPKTEYSPCSA